MAKRPQSLDEFWPYYLSEHRSAASRRLHFVGTAGFMTAMGVSAAMNPVRFPLAIAAALAIGDRLGQVMVLQHPAHIQVLQHHN